MQAPPPSAVSYTYFDWFLVLIVVISALAAFQKGFIRAALSLGGLVTGIIVASWEYIVLAQALNRWIIDFAVAEVVSFVFILALVVVAFTMVASVLRRATKAIGLGLVDRILGGAFGVLRGMLIGVAVMMAITAFMPQSPWLKNSRLSPYFLAGVHAVSFVVPDHFQEQISAGALYLLHETPELLRAHTLTQHM